jgi:ABC-type transport system involved in cytochrome c biogenesis permease subunit
VLINLLSWSAYFFPNDFYLPFLQFKTLFAHGFFLLGVLGRALFLVAGTGAVMLLMGKSGTDKARSIGRFVLWGFFFWTLSVFSGAVWSWLGWGSPIVWDDPVITTTMATWLLYSLMLHLHLTRFSSADSRAWFALAGAAWVFCFNCMPELGPFRPPGWFL